MDSENFNINLNIKEKCSIKSCFIKNGNYLKEYNNEGIYEFNNFEFLKLGKEFHIIGSGAFGDVFLAKNKINGKYYAIKKMEKNRVIENGGSSELILREISIHRRLVHDNIVRLYSHHEDESHFYLVMDYVNKGTLYQLIKMNSGLDEKQAFRYFIQVVGAVQFLHENNLIHRDLKPENLLIDENDQIKLCDFGWCVELKMGNRVTFCGTFEYMAPELIKELPYNHAVDIWSLGILLYELIYGYSPFSVNNSTTDDYTQIFKNILKNNLKFDNNVSTECADLIQKLLTLDNKNRIKIRDIFSHPWVKSFEEEYICEITRIKQETDIKETKIRDSINDLLLSHISDYKMNNISNNNSYIISNLNDVYISNTGIGGINSKNTKIKKKSILKPSEKQITKINKISYENEQFNKDKKILKVSINSKYDKNNKSKRSNSNVNLPSPGIEQNQDVFFQINAETSGVKTTKFTLPTTEIKNQNDNLFDKVLNQLTNKNKLNRSKHKNSENVDEMMNKKQIKLIESPSNKTSNKFLKIENINIEIKGDNNLFYNKISNTEYENLNSKEDVTYFQTENNHFDIFEKLNSHEEIDNEILFKEDEENEIYNIFDSHLIENKKNFPIENSARERETSDSQKIQKMRKSHLHGKDSIKLAKLNSCNAVSDYNAVLSTESQFPTVLDISSYDTYVNPYQRMSFSTVEILERANESKTKIVNTLEVDPVKEKQPDFWDNIVNIFTPFKCDNK